MPVIDVYKKYKRECLDRSDGHKHCQVCNKCPRLTKGKIYTIKDDDGTEFDLCYSCREKKWEDIEIERDNRLIMKRKNYAVMAIHRGRSDEEIIAEITTLGAPTGTMGSRNFAEQIVQWARKWYEENKENLIKYLEENGKVGHRGH